MADTGIVIVTWNSGAEIGPCLDAALRSGADVLVVDNASEDNTREEVRRRGVRLIANAANLGFAAAVNQGFRALENPFILLLNPDAVLERGLDELVKACRQPGAAAAGGQLLGADGRPQAGFMVRRFPGAAALCCEALLLNRLWPSNPVNRRYRCLAMDHSLPQEVEQPAGAFLMVRREAWVALGGFDEGYYPIWFEDVDFCKRAHDRGYHLFYVPQAVAKHTGGHSIPGMAVQKRLVCWYRSLLRYAVKHISPGKGRLVCLAVMAGICLRMAASRSWQQIRGYSRAAQMAFCVSIGGWRPGSQLQFFQYRDDSGSGSCTTTSYRSP